MDRNQATGLILIALLVILYFQFLAPEPPIQEKQAAKEQIDEGDKSNSEVSTQSDTLTSEVLPDSVLNERLQSELGIFSPGGTGTINKTTIETNDLEIIFSNKGAFPEKVTLKQFQNSRNQPLVLFNENSSRFKLTTVSNGKQIDLNTLFYSISKKTESDTILVTFNLNLGSGKSVSHIYSIPNDGYQIGYELKMNGLSNNISQDQLSLEWNEKMLAQENDIEMSRRNSTINSYTADDDFDNLTEASNSLEEESVNKSVKWVSIKQRFFLAAMVAEKSFSSGKFSTNVDESNPDIVKDAKVSLKIPKADVVSGEGKFKFFFGPNDYYLLDDVAPEFSKNLSLGWPPMKWVNQLVIIPLFDFLSSFIGNYGVIIIIMVLIIKLALSPLSYKSYVSMAKMKVLKPQLDEIKESHGDDMAKAQKDQMKLYQQVGVNPVSGCIPMLLQMPILLAMFYFFPQSIELRQEGFLWANDLSTYDSILSLPFEIPFYGDHVSLFVLLMTASTIMMTYSQQQVSTVQGPMKAFSYMMPLIFMFVLNSYPAALSFYYFISNLVTFGQQTLIRKFIDEDKIEKILEENKLKNKNKKKSKFQQRLEQAMKAQDQKKKK